MTEPKKHKAAGKISIDRLAHLETFTYDRSPLSQRNALYRFEESNGQIVEFLWRPKRHQKRLFVLFSGDARRPKFTPPVFQRWTWAKYFPGSVLFFSDPSLHLSDRLGLSWYSGTTDYDPLQTMARIAQEVADQLDIGPERIFSYGSSGGGFAGLRFSSLIPDAGAVTINPQIIIPKYIEKHVRLYLDTCFGGISFDEALDRYPDRFDLTTIAERFRDKPVIYLQNQQDEHHYHEHFMPFCKALGETPGSQDTTGLFRQIIFSNSGGHAKAESMDEFAQAMEIVTSY